MENEWVSEELPFDYVLQQIKDSGEFLFESYNQSVERYHPHVGENFSFRSVGQIILEKNHSTRRYCSSTSFSNDSSVKAKAKANKEIEFSRFYDIIQLLRNEKIEPNSLIYFEKEGLPQLAGILNIDYPSLYYDFQVGERFVLDRSNADFNVKENLRFNKKNLKHKTLLTDRVIIGFSKENRLY